MALEQGLGSRGSRQPQKEGEPQVVKEWAEERAEVTPKGWPHVCCRRAGLGVSCLCIGPAGGPGRLQETAGRQWN